MSSKLFKQRLPTRRRQRRGRRDSWTQAENAGVKASLLNASYPLSRLGFWHLWMVSHSCIRIMHLSQSSKWAIIVHMNVVFKCMFSKHTVEYSIFLLILKYFCVIIFHSKLLISQKKHGIIHVFFRNCIKHVPILSKYEYESIFTKYSKFIWYCQWKSTRSLRPNATALCILCLLCLRFYKYPFAVFDRHI